ncbi:protein kinase family protein [Lysinibacillus sp. KU-BSD001]|uniref:protein kinase family protein n=1 Tax=Lysinibacillus sp. KU-BSD001 TaxID=3141328 RepID=UPI0036E29A0A
MKYQKLAASVVMSKKGRIPKLKSYSEELQLIGIGRSAYVFKVQHEQVALKVFFPHKAHIASEEAAIYRKLPSGNYYPTLYDVGMNYIVIDYLEGHTLFQCLENGIYVCEEKIHAINEALEMAREVGLNPSDIHLKNIIITPKQEVKLIDVARFRQTKKDRQWDDLQKVYFKGYVKSYFPKRIPKLILNCITVIYKTGLRFVE